MFIPHANPNDPAVAGSSRTVVRANAGSAALTARPGNRTREVQSPDSCRSNTTSSGTPGRTRITSGLYPPRTVTRTRCTPPDSSAARARRGPKKNHPSPPTAAAAASTTMMSAAFIASSPHNVSVQAPTVYPPGVVAFASRCGTFGQPPRSPPRGQGRQRARTRKQVPAVPPCLSPAPSWRKPCLGSGTARAWPARHGRRSHSRMTWRIVLATSARHSSPPASELRTPFSTQ